MGPDPLWRQAGSPMIAAILLAPHLALPVLAAEDPSARVPTGEMDWTGVLDEESFAALHDLKEGETPELLGDDVEVAGMDCYLSRPKGGNPIGAVLVIHEWWGLNDNVKHWADRLASDGYVALAVDLYEGTIATTRDEAMAAMRGVEAEAATAKLVAAHAWLRDGDGPVAAERTACIGWCFGGGWSLNLAIAEPELDAAIVYYGRLVTDAETLGAIEAPILGVFGEQDRGIPPSAVEAFESAMGEAGKDVTVRMYDAEHAFANPSSARYDAEHAAAAWQESRAFLAEHMMGEQPGETFYDGERSLEADAPEGWDLGDPARMRLATYVVTGSTTCVISAFPGDVGGLEANIQRWRGQVGLDPMGGDEIEALPTVPILGRLAPVLRAEGPLMSRGEVVTEDGAVAVVYCQLEAETVIVKLQGDRAEVDDCVDGFVALCRSIR